MSLTCEGMPLSSLLVHFRCDAPPLEKLDISTGLRYKVALRPEGALFDGDLLSLREPRLSGVSTDFPWKNLANLQAVELDPDAQGYGITQPLNFFESAPQMPDLSGASPERIVPLVSLPFESRFAGDESPLPEYRPGRPPIYNNLSLISPQSIFPSIRRRSSHNSVDQAGVFARLLCM